MNFNLPCMLNKEKLISFAQITIINFVSILTACISVFIWFFTFREDAKLEAIIEIFQIAYFSIIGAFLVFSSLKNKIIITILKSFIKIFFNVWIIIFVLLVIQEQSKQNAPIIIITLYFGYLEVILDLYNSINENIIIYNQERIFGINKKIILKSTRQFSIIIISIIHFIVPFLLKDVLQKLLR